MEDADAQRQIDQMVAFIINEAKDKAAEIEAKSQEDFNVEKLKALQAEKEKIRQQFKKEAKETETKRAIDHSAAINKARLKKIAARQIKINDAVKLAAKSLSELCKDSNKYSKLCCDLIVQSLMLLLEPKVLVRVRKQDEQVIGSILKQAEARYIGILDAAGIPNQKVSVQIDTVHYLYPAEPRVEGEATCAGGVICTSLDGKIKCDNTFDARLEQVVQQRLPAIRKVLYGN